MGLAAILDEADEALERTCRWWPLGVPQPDPAPLYENVLRGAHRWWNKRFQFPAHLGLGKYWGMLSSPEGFIPEAPEKAFFHLSRAYAQRPQDGEARYCFALICYLTEREAQAPFPKDSDEFRELERRVRPPSQ